MFSAFSGWVSSAADAVNKLSEEGLDAVRQTGIIDALQSVATQPTSADAASAEKQLTLTDLMTPPSTWAGSVEEWEWCIEAAMNDANTCAITPATMKADDNLWQETHSLLTSLDKRAAASTASAETAAVTTPTAATALENIETTFTPAADLVAFVQSHASVYEVRSYVVPLFTSDEDYWLNIGWRLSLYRLCTNTADLLKVLQTLSKLPARLHDIADAEKRAAEAAAAKRAAALAEKKNEDADGEGVEEEEEEEEEEYVETPHLSDNSAYWREMTQQYEAEREKYAWLRDVQERVKKEMELARGNVKLLESLLQRQQASSPLSVSVCDSCKYHKVKLSRLIADVCAAPEENTRGTVLDSESGALFQELFQCNEDVKNILHAYAGRGQDGGPTTPASTSSAPTSPQHDAAAQRKPSASPPQLAEARPTTSPKIASAESSSAVELSAAGSAHDVAATPKSDSDGDEGSFEAKLPWSMDD